MHKEAVLLLRWLETVMIRFWGWLGALSTLVFAADWIPAVHSFLTCYLGQNHRWALLIGGLSGILLSSFFAWRAEELELAKFKYPDLELEFHKDDVGYLEPARQNTALYIRVLPTTNSFVDDAIGYLDNLYREENGEWKLVGLHDCVRLHWSGVHEQRLFTGDRPPESKAVPIIAGSRQFLDVAYFSKDLKELSVATDFIPLEVGELMKLRPLDAYRFDIRVVGKPFVNKSISLSIRRSAEWSKPEVCVLSDIAPRLRNQMKR